MDSEDHHWDFGAGAGFYLDATQAPWACHWRMPSYLLQELIPGVVAQGQVDGDRLGITGHSMGGHGALTLALRQNSLHPQRVGLCAHLRAHPVRLGQEGFHRLPGSAD